MVDSLRGRGKAIEDLFIGKKDQQTLKKIREEAASKEDRDALQSASGIEDTVVLDGLLEAGTSLESPWLGQELLDSWKAYIVAIKETLQPAISDQLKTSILGRAELVAKAAGGFLDWVTKSLAPSKRCWTTSPTSLIKVGVSTPLALLDTFHVNSKRGLRLKL